MLTALGRCRVFCGFVIGAALAASPPVEAATARLEWVPVDATVPHVINGNRISLAQGDAYVTLEFRISGWDPAGNGDPRIETYQGTLDTAGFTAGEQGALEVRPLVCTSDEDCFGVIQCGLQIPGFCDEALQAPYIASWLFVDINHPDFIFFQQPAVAAATNLENTPRFGATLFGGAPVPDLGVSKYGCTLFVYVPADARGEFTVDVETDGVLTFLIANGIRENLPFEVVSAEITVGIDCNDNGVADLEDIVAGTSLDCNGNSLPDECEADCNGNEVPDDCDIAQQCSSDCDGNAVPDECEADCNGNGVNDACDLANGTSTDCDGDGVPDDCFESWYTDCNQDGQPDYCEIGGSIKDCNGNLFPDGCDIESSYSSDCNVNGVPDECEPDCNGNDQPDECDITVGVSQDTNLDGVPDECVPGMALVPVVAAPGYYLADGEIRVPAGGSRVTLDARVFGWDPDMDGQSLLRDYQFLFDIASMANGLGAPLTLANVPCVDDEDCWGTLRCGTQTSGFCESFLANSPAAYIDPFRPDFVFANATTSVGVNTAFVFGAGILPAIAAVPDPGGRWYTGTLILDVPSDASGTYSVRIENESGYIGIDESGDLKIRHLLPALITVVDDCNENGIIDTDDIAGGTSTDCDGNGFPDECDLTLGEGLDCNGNLVLDSCESSEDCNGNGVVDFCDLLVGGGIDANGNQIPDECEVVTPISEAAGGRYLVITPTGTPDARVALKVTSPDFPCLGKFVTKTGGTAVLTDEPTYLPASEWGTVVVGDDSIVPDATYAVVADHDDGVASAPAVLSTPRFGDLAPPYGTVDFKDISAAVKVFVHDSCTVGTERADLFPAKPDGVVDFRDIALVVVAFEGKPYPFAAPCP